MRFLIDAQLPRRLARWLAALGHDAVHTLDLPNGSHLREATAYGKAVAPFRQVALGRRVYAVIGFATYQTKRPPSSPSSLRRRP